MCQLCPHKLRIAGDILILEKVTGSTLCKFNTARDECNASVLNLLLKSPPLDLSHRVQKENLQASDIPGQNEDGINKVWS